MRTVEIIERLRQIAYAVEELPASEQQTKASLMISDLIRDAHEPSDNKSEQKMMCENCNGKGCNNEQSKWSECIHNDMKYWQAELNKLEGGK